MKRSLILTVFSLLVLAQLGLAQVPQTINHQGVLRDASGDIVDDGVYTLTFKLWSAAEGGTELWSEAQSVPVIDGIFSAVLGVSETFSSTLADFESPLWLEMWIEAGPGVTGPEFLSPRIELTAVPYAIKSRGVAGSTNVFPGSGSVGIGTTTPGVKLHIVSPNADGIILTDSSTVTYRATLFNWETMGGQLNLNDATGAIQARIRGYASPGGVQASFTAGNVGIGTATPGEKLEVLGNIGVNDYDLYLRSDRLHGIGAYSDTKKFGTIAMDGPIVYGAGGGALGTNDGSLQNIALYWNQAGNVGIGTATPYGFTKLHIYDAAQASLMIEGEGDAWNYSQLVLGSGANNKTWALLHGKAIGMENKLQIQEYDGAAYSPRLVIQPGGNVGIGTTSPEAMLHIASPDAGGIILTDASSGRYSATLRNFGLGGQLNLLDSLQASGARIRGYAYNGVQAYFTAGNVGIGTATPTAKLEVVGVVKADTLQLTTPAERWYAIPAPAFRHERNSTQYDSPYFTWNYNGGNFFAPVHLPHGATITGFEANIYDNDSVNVTIELASVYQNNTSYSAITSWATSGESATVQTLSNYTLSQPVDNQNNTYMVYVYWTTPQTGSNIKIHNARIKYTVDQPLP